jgi:hypothetical protein
MFSGPKTAPVKPEESSDGSAKPLWEWKELIAHG